MIRTRAKLFDNRELDDSSALICQLEREITCLERQLDRLRLLNRDLDRRTEETYQDMIINRKEMLSQLGF